MGTGFTNSFTAGEICEDAWDRTDIQPVAKGCEEAINYVVRVPGPLGKRRGFWRLGDALDIYPSRLIPFRKSIDDALLLEFTNYQVRVWNNDGSVLLDGSGDPVVFASPYGEGDLDGLRFKQVGDVIYIRHRIGLGPQSLERKSNTEWVFAQETFPNGPWRAENIDPDILITVTGTDEVDANPETSGGSILVGEAVDLAATTNIFLPGHVGTRLRLRAALTAPGVKSWSVGFQSPVGYYCLSNGRVYVTTVHGAHQETITNAPSHTQGIASDGGNSWAYRHDGAGIVEITAVADGMNATATVVTDLPFKSGSSTSYFAEAAYSSLRGWPRMWPGLREERLVEGATAANPDFIDLTETAGFTPTSESFTPGLGTGQVVATDAVRRRAGADSAELIWAIEAAFLLAASDSGEYLVAGSVLDEPISPTSVVVKPLSDFGSADVYPAKAHKGLIFVTRGGQDLRELAIDTNQGESDQDLSFLATHIANRGMVQLAWVPQPDNALWIRLADGGVAVMTYHKEQQVRGFTRVSLPAGFVCEDIAVLPGPGRLETLWMTVSRVKDGATQRHIWMQSQVSDALFMDGAEFYEGAPVATIAGLGHYDGETVRVLADGGQIDGLVVGGGEIVMAQAASRALVGLPMLARFKSLKLDTNLGGSLLARQRVVGCKVSLKTAAARVGLDGRDDFELVTARTPADVPVTTAVRVSQDCTIFADTDRDPRILIEDDTAFDGVIYSLKPKVGVGDG